jgi:transposase
VLVVPQRARSFARAIGRLAKTDRIDALVLARMVFVAVENAPLWVALDKRLSELRDPGFRDDEVVALIDAERKCRAAASVRVLASLRRSDRER